MKTVPLGRALKSKALVSDLMLVVGLAGTVYGSAKTNTVDEGVELTFSQADPMALRAKVERPSDRSLNRMSPAKPASTTIVISIVSMTLAEVNAAAELITGTLKAAGNMQVNCDDVATAIFRRHIQLAADGAVAAIYPQAIASANL